MHHYSRRTLILACAVSLLLASCSTTSRLQPSHVPPGSDRLAEVMALATRDRIVNMSAYQEMLNSGISDSQIVDGSLAAGRVYCCGDTDKSTAIWFYVPSTLKVQPGDIVEVQMGSGSGAINVALSVRESAGAAQKHCHWDPPDESLWMRVLYCDWMPNEGWVEQKSALYHTWTKPSKQPAS